MIFQAAVTLVIAVTYLGRIAAVPIAFTVGISVCAFGLVYWSTEESLDSVRPPRSVESLSEMVQGLQASMDTPVRKTYLVEDETPRAEVRPLVFHRTVDLYLTTGLLEDLDVDEVSAVIAHELAHVTYYDHHYRTFAAMVEVAGLSVASTIVFWVASRELPDLLVNAGSFNSFATDGVIVLGVPVAAAFLVWVSARSVTASYRRTSEFAADRGAGEVASFESMYTALITLDADQLVGPSPGFIERAWKGYPLTNDRLTHLHLAAETENDIAEDEVRSE